MLPKKVKIINRTYKVKIIKNLQTNDGTYLFGAVDHTKRTIRINKNMHPEVMFITLLHEVFHAIVHITGHSEVDGTDEEVIIEALSQSFPALLRQNPKLFGKRK